MMPPTRGERERILLDGLDGMIAPAPAGDRCAMLAEGLPPLCVRLTRLPSILAMLKCELSDESIGRMDRVRACGSMPALVFLDGMVRVFGKRTAVCVQGGEA